MGDFHRIAGHIGAQDAILSFLNLDDVLQLMRTNQEIRSTIIANRLFWTRHALRLYEMDPIIFVQFQNPALYTDDALYEQVVKANARRKTIMRSMFAQSTEEDIVYMDGSICALAVDEKEGVVAVSLDDEVQIHSLLRFGDPPLQIIKTIKIDEIIVHGGTLICRPPRDRDFFHADVINWKTEDHFPSLCPELDKTAQFPLKASEKFLLAYDVSRNLAMAYPFSNDGSVQIPIFFQFPDGSRLVDYAMKDEKILAILTDQCSHCFIEHDVLSGKTTKSFLVAAPAQLHSPSIAFPFIFVTQAPLPKKPVVYMDDIIQEIPLCIYGTRILIPGGDIRPWVEGRVFGDVNVPIPNAKSQFYFIRDKFSYDIYVVYVGSIFAQFRRVDTASYCEPIAIASVGLSYVFARGPQLVFRRFSQRPLPIFLN